MKNKLAYIQSRVRSLPFDWTKIKSIVIEESNLQKKKYKAVITYSDGKRRTIHFGAKGMQDYLDHRDDERRESFRSRFGALYSKQKGNELSGLAYSYPLLW